MVCDLYRCPMLPPVLIFELESIIHFYFWEFFVLTKSLDVEYVFAFSTYQA